MAKLYFDVTPTPWTPRNGTAGAAIDALYAAAQERKGVFVGHISVTLTGLKAEVVFEGQENSVKAVSAFLKQRVQERCDVVRFLLGVDDK